MQLNDGPEAINMNAQSQVATLCDRVEQLRKQGLSDLKFYAGEVSESSPETFAKEANAMLDAIEAGKFKPLKFNDSQAKPV
jgi:hypothetical protein